MTIFRFSIEIGGLDLDDAEHRFYGNGVDDVLICVVDGRLLLDFDREAADQEAAIGSAMNDITQCGGSVVRVTWDAPRTWEMT